MPSCAPLEAGLPVRITKSGGAYYAAIDGSTVFGAGATWEEALEKLDQQHRDLTAFADATGLPMATLIGPARISPASPRRPRWISQMRTAAIVIACFGLMMVPLSYGLSTAIERTAANLGRDLRQTFQQLATDPDNDAVPGTRARPLVALRTAVQRARPYLDEIRPLFGCPDANAAPQP